MHCVFRVNERQAPSIIITSTLALLRYYLLFLPPASSLRLYLSAGTKHNSIKNMKHYTCSGSGVARIPVAPMVAQGRAEPPEPRPPPAPLTPESHDPGPEPESDTREREEINSHNHRPGVPASSPVSQSSYIF